MSWFGLLNLLLTGVGVLYWFRGLNQGFCLHDYYTGRQKYLTGALTCSRCGRIQYPEKMKLLKLYRALGRVHTEK